MYSDIYMYLPQLGSMIVRSLVTGILVSCVHHPAQMPQAASRVEEEAAGV